MVRHRNPSSEPHSMAKSGHGTAPAADLAGPGPASVQAASNEADSATSAVTRAARWR